LNDGSCEYTSCAGCTIQQACNYDPNAIIPDVSTCIFLTVSYLDCEGNCINDANNNGICDEVEVVPVLGCTNPNAINFNPLANTDNGTCVLAVPGCLIPFACNYNPAATVFDGSCDFASCVGCTNPAACNYNPTATVAINSTCTYPVSPILNCNGGCLNDTDGDGICNENEVAGCTNVVSPNYNPYATDDNGTCQYGGCTLPFACNYDPEADFLIVSTCNFQFPCTSGMAAEGPTMAFMSTLCTHPFACNYNQEGPCDFLSCLALGCTDPTACNFDSNALYNDGSCDYLSCLVPGCTNDLACNYNPEATTNDGSCDFSSCYGCTDPEADNYDAEATLDNGNCIFGGCTLPGACNFDAAANFNDGSCDFESCVGCMNEVACNYDAEAIYNGTCDFTSCVGCTDPSADNYDEAYTLDNGSCIFSGCTIPAACNFDANANANDGSCEFTSCVGCLDVTACNFDMDATLDDVSSCTYPAYVGFDCNGDCIDANDNDVCDYVEAMEVDGSQFCGAGTVWDPVSQTCVVVQSCQGDFNNDGLVQLEDLLQFLLVYGTVCE
jgi:hypothetical protein